MKGSLNVGAAICRNLTSELKERKKKVFNDADPGLFFALSDSTNLSSLGPSGNLKESN